MAVVLKLIRRPRSASYRKKAVQEELLKGLQTMVDPAIERLKADVEEWVNQPEFKVKVSASGRRVSFNVSVDKRGLGGKLYGWVNFGTGERGGGDAYEIAPHGDYPLGPFLVPHSPKTFPNPPIAGFPSSEEPHWVAPFVVHAPGIHPRNFTTTIMKEMRERGAGKFANVIDASIKKGLRK